MSTAFENFRSRIFHARMGIDSSTCGRLHGVAQIDSFTPSFWIWITYLLWELLIKKNRVLGRRWRGEGEKHANSYTVSHVLFLHFEKRSFLTGVSFFSGFGFAQIRSLNVIMQFRREIAS